MTKKSPKMTTVKVRVSSPRLEVIEESPTGLNTRFKDTRTGERLTRGQVADRIERNAYPDYHNMRDKDGRRIPRSNPNDRTDDNLG